MQLELERVVAELCSGGEAKVALAGRTDSGVHAVGQVASTLDRRPELTERELQRALNARLPSDLAVLAVERMPAGFHARHDARWREYRYRIWSGVRQPLVAEVVTQWRRELDVAAMAEAAAKFVGNHDFAGFGGAGTGVPWSPLKAAPRGSRRTIHRCSVMEIEPWWRQEGGSLIELSVVADAFLPRMVRNMVGALLEIGTGRNKPDWIEHLIQGADRRRAGMTAPPHGLILWRVGYDDDTY